MCNLIIEKKNNIKRAVVIVRQTQFKQNIFVTQKCRVKIERQLYYLMNVNFLLIWCKQEFEKNDTI